jgi:hypothetical protein
MNIYALLTDDGTAASETALCERHLKDSRAREDAWLAAGEDIPEGDFADCSGNDYLRCRECGRRGSP